jgi:hypothetical protein
MNQSRSVGGVLSEQRVIGGRRRAFPNPTWYLIAFTAASIAAAFLLPAMPQPASYHDFADQRELFGIPNFFDVVSNGAFLLAGVGGLVAVLRPRTVFEHGSERWPYAVFFIGVALTAFGSGYYHLAPDNERLVWDRLPMTIAFMALISAQIVDRISLRAGMVLLLPMLAIGATSVLYWISTERAGAGNLVPYAVLQAYSVVAVLGITYLYPSRYTRGSDMYWVFAAYVAAKILETFDRPILELGHFLSGHTLKHLAAALAAGIVMRMLWLRRAQPAPQPGNG